VRSGPILTKNIAAFLTGGDLIPYKPQTEFLALMMTGDGKAVGTKFGIAFAGKWVWKMKDYIDVSFMNLFNKHYLFEDFETKGYADPVKDNHLFESENAEKETVKDEIRTRVNAMGAEEAG
jgi:NADH dehydrogenase FAD-containing subunit